MAARLLVAREASGGWTIDFPHPLVRAAVYHDLGPARRSALHARAAGLVEDPIAAMRHRVAAAPGQDGALADEVTRFARRQADAGEWAAARSLLAAARLAPSRSRRDELLLEAVDCMLLAGEVAEAAGFTSEIAGFADTARRRYVLGRLASVAGRHAEAAQLLQGAWEGSDPVADASLRADLAELLALKRAGTAPRSPLPCRRVTCSAAGGRALVDA
jgi:thioredoxin-like negative regulator of GroEL